MEQKEFYQYFKNFETIDKNIWLDIIKITIEKVKAESVYPEYAVREKILSFYFTLIEELKTHRAFALLSFSDNFLGINLSFQFLDDFKREFNDYAKELIEEGQATEEIIDRPIVSKVYKDALWGQTFFILRFWINDFSKEFEKTDAAIEKVTNLSFDLLGHNPIDGAFDFGKFLLQNIKFPFLSDFDFSMKNKKEKGGEKSTS
ncbi:MAG: TetR/AcrR family transcriptional regulator [Flammeovirgaceae bacterium]|nr:TetR/AcrR family transcriptional regulator [Flammeovirgaceae bacterium]